METNRDSNHQSQNEDNFPTFSLGLEFLNGAEKNKNNTVRSFTETEMWRVVNWPIKTYAFFSVVRRILYLIRKELLNKSANFWEWILLNEEFCFLTEVK